MNSFCFKALFEGHVNFPQNDRCLFCLFAAELYKLFSCTFPLFFFICSFIHWLTRVCCERKFGMTNAGTTNIAVQQKKNTGNLHFQDVVACCKWLIINLLGINYGHSVPAMHKNYHFLLLGSLKKCRFLYQLIKNCFNKYNSL